MIVVSIIVSDLDFTPIYASLDHTVDMEKEENMNERLPGLGSETEDGRGERSLI